MPPQEKPRPPLDEFTGLVHLPFIPPEEGVSVNRHHHQWPRYLEEQKGCTISVEGNKAVINSLVQTVDFYDHKEAHWYYGSSEFPETNEGKFDYLTWISLGYIPTHGLVFINGKPVKRPLETHHVDRLRQGELRIASEYQVQRFMNLYILDTIQREHAFIKPSKVDELLSSTDPVQKDLVGQWVFERGVEFATEGLRAKYRLAHKNGLVSSENSPRLTTAVAEKVLPYRIEHETIPRLIARLRTVGAKAVNGEAEVRQIPLAQEALRTEADEVQLAA